MCNYTKKSGSKRADFGFCFLHRFGQSSGILKQNKTNSDCIGISYKTPTTSRSQLGLTNLVTRITVKEVMAFQWSQWPLQYPFTVLQHLRKSTNCTLIQFNQRLRGQESLAKDICGYPHSWRSQANRAPVQRKTSFDKRKKRQTRPVRKKRGWMASLISFGLYNFSSDVSVQRV